MILVVFLLRSFLFEPFKIPSGSMMPTLLVGDLILVNKFHYGVRLPVINKKIVANNDPQRGDVMVFRYPQDPSIDYIKRVVGLPGDEVAYLQPAALHQRPAGADRRRCRRVLRRGQHALRRSSSSRSSARVEHRILDRSATARRSSGTPRHRFPFRENCRYSAEGVTCKVPPGHYFMMGDNRDNSQDSRYWGFVPDENIVGKAFFVWMNFGNLEAHRVVPLIRPESARSMTDEPSSSQRAARQRGITLFGLLFWAIVIGFVALIGMRVLPTRQRILHDQAGGQQDRQRRCHDGAGDPHRLRAAEGHRVLDHLDHRQGSRASPRRTTRS